MTVVKGTAGGRRRRMPTAGGPPARRPRGRLRRMCGLDRRTLWWGGAGRAFTITHGWAPPGYLAGPITPGTWNILLGPYQIVGDGTPYRVEVTLHWGRQRRAFIPAPAPQEVPGTGSGWYRGDLH